MLYKFFIIFLYAAKFVIKAEIVFKQDLGDDTTIGIPETGYKNVQLKCGSDSMNVDLQTDVDFTGVIYTKGSFHEKSAPCFLDPGLVRGQRAFTIKFPLDKCNTKKEGDIYTNVVVLQYDKELIMPGDAAFKLECDFGTPRDITVQANLKSQNAAVSRITLTDADPSDRNKRNTGRVFENASYIVEIAPDVRSGRPSTPKIEL